ncbi:MAG TPA: NAD(P)-dependent oxidoreductase [Candidatus Eisenbacteria bacterium]|nr:NAD(P)-dependent oxidoreductase [Candidatus Eisenbacteria bacterium]
MPADPSTPPIAARRVLLTGATGFVGSHLAHRLLDHGVPVRAIVRRAGADVSLLRPGYEEVVGDFVEPAVSARAAEGCDLVLHAAATSGPEFEPVRRVNVDGTRSLLDAARAAGASRFIQISTLSVYDVGGLDEVDEDSPLKTGTEPYGVTKAEGDRLVFGAAADGLAATILRPGAILGVHPTSTWAVKVPARIREGQIKLLRDGGNTMPFVHVRDLVDAVFLAVASPRSVGRAYNVLEMNGTWRMYTDEVRGWFGLPELERVPDAEAAAMTYWTGRFSAKRLRSELGWSPKCRFEQGMAESKTFWASSGSGAAPPGAGQ